VSGPPIVIQKRLIYYVPFYSQSLPSEKKVISGKSFFLRYYSKSHFHNKVIHKAKRKFMEAPFQTT